MAIEPEQDREPPRRKFDDVASLFGNIVPPPGTQRRPVENRLPPPEVTPPPPPHPAPEPAPAPAPPRQAVFQEEARPAPLPDLDPKAKRSYRPRPTELPWPDAFEPRPNFRRRESRNWSWLLLIPVGFLAAVAITTLDPRTIRSWLDTHVFHRQPVSGSLDAPLLTAPTPMPTPLAQIPAEVPIPYPAIPTSPVPVPPGVEVSPPPPTPAETAAAAAAPIHITIQYRRAIPGAEGEARRVAALLQSYGGSIEMHPNPTTVRAPTINYYNPADKTAATALATVLANEAANWIVRVGTTKNPLGTLDIWLP